MLRQRDMSRSYIGRNLQQFSYSLKREENSEVMYVKVPMVGQWGVQRDCLNVPGIYLEKREMSSRSVRSRVYIVDLVYEGRLAAVLRERFWVCWGRESDARPSD